MGTPLLHVGAVVQCMHAAPVTMMSANVRVRVGGQPVVTAGDVFLVGGCPFVAGLIPSPCLTLQWMTFSTRIKVMGQPVLLASNMAMGISPVLGPQGPAIVVMSQVRATGQ